MNKRSNPLDRFARDLPPGSLTWIGLRTQRRGHIDTPAAVTAIAGRGLEGDHRVDKTPGSGRQVTVISSEFIQQTAHFLGRDSIDPALLRRNLVVSGINLHALRYQRFRIGEAVFEANALCHPCSRMESALGKGGVAAMLGHGGLCCRVLHGGR
ncbi:MAG: MOSC domain-containing protein, partial [Halieaceae bacterium]|nr:MOSC domain-containing protein [Halieaceae bacterium]